MIPYYTIHTSVNNTFKRPTNETGNNGQQIALNLSRNEGIVNVNPESVHEVKQSFNHEYSFFDI